MNGDNLRAIMTKALRHQYWLDYCFERGDNNAKDYNTYEDWLNSLDDEDFLDAYNRVKDAYRDLGP